MNMTTHSKATLEIVIHNTEVSDAIADTQVLELQSGEMVRMQARAGNAYQIVQQGPLADELVLAEMGDDLHVTLTNGATFVLTDYVALCNAGLRELVSHTQDGDNAEKEKEEDAVQQAIEFDIAADEAAVAADGELVENTSQAMDAVAAAVEGPFMAEAEDDDDDEAGAWLWSGAGLIATAGIAAIVGDDDGSPAATPIPTAYNVLVALGPVLDGNTELAVELFRADGSLLGVSDVHSSETGRLTFVDETNYLGVVIARLRDSGDGADYFDEATAAPLDVPHDHLLAVTTVSGDEVIEGQVVIDLQSNLSGR